MLGFLIFVPLIDTFDVKVVCMYCGMYIFIDTSVLGLAWVARRQARLSLVDYQQGR